MIIMLNGSFGVGKSTTAELLVSHIPGAALFDPEELGFPVRRITTGLRTSEEETDDFQDIPMWRTLAVAAGQQLYRRYGRPLVVPMTLARPDYLETFRAGFEAVAPTYHFCLIASLERIQQRLLKRNAITQDAGPDSWPWRKAQQIVPLLHDPIYAVHINTEERTPEQVVHEILGQVQSRDGG